MKEKIFVTILMLMLTFSAICFPKNTIVTVTASDGYEEVSLDYDWIYDIIVNMSEIINKITTHDIYEGRAFGGEGDQAAADYVFRWMNESTRNIENKSIYKSRIGSNDYEGNDEQIIHNADNKIDILSYELIFTNGTDNATIPNNESYPIPQLIFGLEEKEFNSSGYQKVELYDINDFSNLLYDSIPYTYQMMDYFNQYGISNFSSEVVLIDDYSSTSINETTDKIHLLEFNTNESEDAYYDKIQKVLDSDGAGFVIITTNPSYLKNLSTSSFGVAVSPYEGEKIKNYLLSNKTVVATFYDNLEGEQVEAFDIFVSTRGNGLKKIGLIEEKGDQPIFIKPGIFNDKKYSLLDVMTKLASKPFSDYVGFLFYNKTFNKVHYMMGATGYPWAAPIVEFLTFSNYWFCPFFFINGSVTLDSGGSINIWDWAKNDSNLQASFKIREQRNYSAESYNVICEIEGKNPNKSIMISGGHHDFLNGQGATDNAAGVAVMLGILKWLNETGITPEYNLTFVSFSGEECVDRGSGSYVFNDSFASKNSNMTYMLNLDWLAHNTTNSTLRISVTNDLLKTTVDKLRSRTHYVEKFMDDLNKNYKIEVWNESVGNDALPFYNRYVEGMLFRSDEKTDLGIIGIGKEKTVDKRLVVMYARHRSGVNHTLGDTLGIIDRDDLNITADIALNITQYLILEPPENQIAHCDFTPFDSCGDSWNDSVNISCNVTTDRTSWVTIEACIHDVSTGINVSDTSSTWFTVYKDENTSGQVKVTLYPTMNNGSYNVSIRLLDDKDNVDDECHQLVNLSPYGKPIANFDYELYGFINHSVNFTDTSMASPGADIDEWYWNFDDGTHSHEQNPSHTYLLSKSYTVTLTIWDTNDFNDSWFDTIVVPNCVPYTSFTMDASAVCVGTDLSFTSTSCDEDGTIENYTWDFGDGCYSYEENPIHSYTQSGVYTVTLMTTDDDGATNTSMITDGLVIADALVDDDFRDDPDAHEWDTITEGLSDVENGGIIYVFNGSYASFEIAKSVSLYGESRENVRINSGNPGVKIRYNNVTINGFNVSSGTIRMDVSVKSDENHSSNITITNCNIPGSGTIGILLNQSSGCLIENCTIRGNTYGVKIVNDSQQNVIRKCVLSQGNYGVYVSDSSYNFIGSPSITNPYPTDCLFTYTQSGVKLVDSDHNFILGCDIDGTPYPGGFSSTTKGIYLDNSENNTVSTCSIHDMTVGGLYLVDSTWNKIEHCKVSWNPIGITFDNSPENLITQNHFGGNSEFAVYMPTDTQFNHVYYNDFFVNGNGLTNQTWDANGAKGAENLWNKDGNNTLTKTGDGEGNYWSDYTGIDDDEDGIGDTPYEINSSGILRNDSYPVMNSYGWCDFTRDSTLPVISDIRSDRHRIPEPDGIWGGIDIRNQWRNGINKNLPCLRGTLVPRGVDRVRIKGIRAIGQSCEITVQPMDSVVVRGVDLLPTQRPVVQLQLIKRTIKVTPA